MEKIVKAVEDDQYVEKGEKYLRKLAVKKICLENVGLINWRTKGMNKEKKKYKWRK